MLPELEQQEISVNSLSKTEELKQSLQITELDDKLMGSVMENDENAVNDGKLVSDAINNSFSSFIPDMMFDNLVKDFSTAKNLYGERVLRLLTDYSPDYIKKNIKIPEFQRELKEKLKEKIDEMKNSGIVDRHGMITKKGEELASLVLYVEELQNIVPKGITGERIHKRSSIYGTRSDIRQYRNGDRYRDIAAKSTVKTAIRRNRAEITRDDIRVFERQSRGTISMIYAIDASGSMRGKKIEAAKKAGIALSYKATSERDKVGLIVFGTEIKEKIEPTLDFPMLLSRLSAVRASKETNMTETISMAAEMFTKGDETKHLVIITDALPTIGKEPEKEVLEKVSIASASGITVSIVGISLDKKGSSLAEKIVELGNGRLYTVKNIEELDVIVLEDYYRI